MLRAHGVVGSFVEFTGPSVGAVPLADRATLANMSPEFGSTCAIFPIDQVTLDYLRFTGRDAELVDAVERYAKEQGLWHDPAATLRYTDLIRLDLSTVEPSLAGPRRPQDRIPLASARSRFQGVLAEMLAERSPARIEDEVDEASQESFPASDAPAISRPATPRRRPSAIEHGAVAIAAITSCTNTSNPSVMVAAGLLARNAVAAGLATKPWVKTSLAPGSKVVTDYLNRSGLDRPLEQLGFHTVGYGCMTCIGNSGPLTPEISKEIAERGVLVAAVLSGNRNFDGRINNDVSLNYLASPPLVVAYALAGSMDVDLIHEPLGVDRSGAAIFLSDLWPSDAEIEAVIRSSLEPEMFTRRYADVFRGEERWAQLPAGGGATFDWNPKSTYVRRPPFLDDIPLDPMDVADIHGARALLVLGDSVTTDHICPAGRIPADSPAGVFLLDQGERDLNTYASRRGNHEVMIRGAFANQRLRNGLVPDRRGGWTLDHLDGVERTIYDATERYRCSRSAARRARRQGIRHRFVAGLGGQGDGPTRCPRGDRRDVRAHPPLEPDRAGRASAAVPARRQRGGPAPDRSRDVRHRGPRRPGRAQLAAASSHPRRPRRRPRCVRGRRETRHGSRGTVLPARGNPALRRTVPADSELRFLIGLQPIICMLLTYSL